ncbi:hypothetical protein GF382_00810 [Candidatus Falkowbacteria bacterium]|nr:hypothetical protein [Candidatus Falkowbacteria bacterium]
MRPAWLFVAMFIACNSIDETNASDCAPDESPVKSKMVTQYWSRPNGFPWFQPWGQALHVDRLSQTSKVEIDYFRTYFVSGNKKTLGSERNYDDWLTGEGEYFMRSPWCQGDPGSFMNVEINDGILIFYPNEKADRIWHWYLPRVETTQKPDYVLMKIRFRLSGGAALQIGGDWVEDGTSRPVYNKNSREIGASDWHCQTNGWCVLSFIVKPGVDDHIEYENQNNAINPVVMRINKGKCVALRQNYDLLGKSTIGSSGMFRGIMIDGQKKMIILK